jgi:hypothetical protein
MTKKGQVWIGWIMVVVLTLFSLVGGVAVGKDHQVARFFLFYSFPILLKGGWAFYRSGQKKKSKNQT